MNAESWFRRSLKQIQYRSVQLGILREEQRARNYSGGFFHSKTEKLIYLEQYKEVTLLCVHNKMPAFFFFFFYLLLKEKLLWQTFGSFYLFYYILLTINKSPSVSFCRSSWNSACIKLENNSFFFYNLQENRNFKTMSTNCTTSMAFLFKKQY